VLKNKEDWRDVLKRRFEDGREACHGGCGDRADWRLALTGKHVGAWCRDCWLEVSSGRIPPLDRRRRG
jgi:hypothetical protein